MLRIFLLTALISIFSLFLVPVAVYYLIYENFNWKEIKLLYQMWLE